MELFAHSCLCGCGAISRTLSNIPVYASQGCKELHTRKRQYIGSKFSRQPSQRERLVEQLGWQEAKLSLDPNVWISAQAIARKLSTHISYIRYLESQGIIPCDKSTGTRLFKLADVIEAMKAYNGSRPKGRKKLLTKYFSRR